MTPNDRKLLLLIGKAVSGLLSWEKGDGKLWSELDRAIVAVEKDIKAGKK